MQMSNGKAKDVKIAFIGGGSTGWAWEFMSDLADCDDMSGDVYLYDIDSEAAKFNEIIGNKYSELENAKSQWRYIASQDTRESMQDADFVVISILPGTMDEMESDVHVPEKYGIYQPVGDSTGPGGIVRAMRSLPMFEEIAENVKKYCPNAWVINYTNPMTLCTKALYYAFPEIKAIGCCHEVFGTQKFLREIIKENLGVENIELSEIKVNPIGVNHFTWLTEAKYKGIDIFPMFGDFCKKHPDGYENGNSDKNWMNSHFESEEKVKMDLFERYGYIAAAGDRHLAEFCEGKWYLESPQRVKDMHFGLTPVSWRKDDYVNTRFKKRAALVSGETKPQIAFTGEEGVHMMRALLGLCEELVTNVNMPNMGQIPNLPMGAVVETNAVLSGDSIRPVMAGDVPKEIYPLISRICSEQELVADGIRERDLEKIFSAFANDPLVTCSLDDARKLFDEMCQNTKEYLKMFNL